MPRPARGKLSPWIETLIRSYGSQQGNSSGRLKAHVIGVGQMSQSQAQGTEGPTGILVLSDGVLQISAVLTATAWEHLQEQEDRECFTSLVNTTVYIQDYRMQFHMALELSKCRFFLLVGKLATTAAGPVKDNTPCCTSLSSVRMKICETWRALLGQETQDQCKFDLSDLLGEWQHGCLEDVLEDVEQRLKVASCHPASPQPSTSVYTSVLTHPGTSSTSNWDVDRVRSKGLKCFSVPIKCLHIPEEDSDQLWIRANPGNRTTTGVFAVSKDRNRDLSEVCKNPESTEQSVDDVEQQTALPAVTATAHVTDENFPQKCFLLHEDMVAQMIDSDSEILSNPWDIFPPCVTSSPSDASPGATQTETFPSSSNGTTSMLLPVHSPTECQQTSEHTKGESSCIPPYQKQAYSTNLPASALSSASVSPPEPFSRVSHLSSATFQSCTRGAQFSALDQEREFLQKDMAESTGRKNRNAKRKTHKPTQETLSTSVEVHKGDVYISDIPPSWLLDTKAASDPKEGSRKGVKAATVLRKTPCLHSDGRPFSYSYQVSGQNLQNCSQFRISESLLLWAVKYLVVPKLTEAPCDVPVPSGMIENT
ncbi:adrenocortical dysplasia protein homolog [Echeneis naucrates]|uniref:adrenocortical dysplasia protein homolog n=1 Tax=Echeneis naucrates TaxID=173247 RepID=UPI0011143814|nr:uncharacterized protein LOC115055977 [Echeneis naucrates]XP_029377998.1 uncharacterized protein LOC115055977 [Echeneis naucrates]